MAPCFMENTHTDSKVEKTNHKIAPKNATPPKTSMTMEHLPFEDVFDIGNGDFPASHVSFQGG